MASYVKKGVFMSIHQDQYLLKGENLKAVNKRIFLYVYGSCLSGPPSGTAFFI